MYRIYYTLPVTCYLSSSCLVAHRASTERLQLILSAAATLVSFHDRQPASALSLSTVRRHVVLGRPRFLRPSGAHVNAMLQSLVGSCLSVCPMNFHHLLLTSSLIGLIFVLIKRSSFLTRSSHFIFMIFLKHLFCLKCVYHFVVSFVYLPCFATIYCKRFKFRGVKISRFY